MFFPSVLLSHYVLCDLNSDSLLRSLLVPRTMITASWPSKAFFTSSLFRTSPTTTLAALCSAGSLAGSRTSTVTLYPEKTWNKINQNIDLPTVALKIKSEKIKWIMSNNAAHSSSAHLILSWQTTLKEEVEGEVGNVGDTTTIHFVCNNQFVTVSCTWLVKGLRHEPFKNTNTNNFEWRGWRSGCHQLSHPCCEREIRNISHCHASIPRSSLQWLSKVTANMTILWLSTYWHFAKGHYFRLFIYHGTV